DVARHLPRYTDSDYGPELLRLADELDAKIFISLNDYELMHIHVNTGLAESLRRRRVLVPGVSPAWQAGCGDKLQMARLLDSVVVPPPSLVADGDQARLAELASRAEEFVDERGFGSGSSGPELVTGRRTNLAVPTALLSAPAAGRAPTAYDVVVQPKLPG